MLHHELKFCTFPAQNRVSNFVSLEHDISGPAAAAVAATAAAAAAAAADDDDYNAEASNECMMDTGDTALATIIGCQSH